jgi:hypothetical protein
LNLLHVAEQQHQLERVYIFGRKLDFRSLPLS